MGGHEWGVGNNDSDTNDANEDDNEKSKEGQSSESESDEDEEDSIAYKEFIRQRQNRSKRMRTSKSTFQMLFESDSE